MHPHRRLILLVVFVAAAVTVHVAAGAAWLWLGTATAAAVFGVHAAVVALAWAVGGASLLGFAANRLHGGSMTTDAADQHSKVLHRPRGYDLLVWALLLGRERLFREKTLDLARVAEGESVLDVGCGTGTLAIAAKRRVGDRGTVTGIDASPEMIGRARAKARKKGVEVDFRTAAAESLPFPDAAFDVVLSSVMLHHLPDAARAACIAEVRRVLKPGGRFLVIEFGGPAERRRTLVGRLHAHAHFDVTRMLEVVTGAGLVHVESGPMGFRDLQFIRAAAPVA